MYLVNKTHNLQLCAHEFVVTDKAKLAAALAEAFAPQGTIASDNGADYFEKQALKAARVLTSKRRSPIEQTLLDVFPGAQVKFFGRSAGLPVMLFDVHAGTWRQEKLKVADSSTEVKVYTLQAIDQAIATQTLLTLVLSAALDLAITQLAVDAGDVERQGELQQARASLEDVLESYSPTVALDPIGYLAILDDAVSWTARVVYGQDSHSFSLPTLAPADTEFRTIVMSQLGASSSVTTYCEAVNAASDRARAMTPVMVRSQVGMESMPIGAALKQELEEDLGGLEPLTWAYTLRYAGADVNLPTYLTGIELAWKAIARCTRTAADVSRARISVAKMPTSYTMMMHRLSGYHVDVIRAHRAMMTTEPVITWETNDVLLRKLINSFTSGIPDLASLTAAGLSWDSHCVGENYMWDHVLVDIYRPGTQLARVVYALAKDEPDGAVTQPPTAFLEAVLNFDLWLTRRLELFDYMLANSNAPVAVDTAGRASLLTSARASLLRSFDSVRACQSYLIEGDIFNKV